MPKKSNLNDKSWVPPAGTGDYTKARRKWNPSAEDLAAALKERSIELRKLKQQERKRSAEVKRRKAS